MGNLSWLFAERAFQFEIKLTLQQEPGESHAPDDSRYWLIEAKKFMDTLISKKKLNMSSVTIM